jgi:hypothetical protein
VKNDPDLFAENIFGKAAGARVAATIDLINVLRLVMFFELR